MLFWVHGVIRNIHNGLPNGIVSHQRKELENTRRDSVRGFLLSLGTRKVWQGSYVTRKKNNMV